MVHYSPRLIRIYLAYHQNSPLFLSSDLSRESHPCELKSANVLCFSKLNALRIAGKTRLGDPGYNAALALLPVET